MDMDEDLKKLGQPFSSFIAMPAKLTKGIVIVTAHRIDY